MKSEAELRKALMGHLEAALAVADELNEGVIGYCVELAMDHAKAGGIEWLRGDLC